MSIQKNVHATIGNYKSHIVQGEEINDDDPYNDISIDDDLEDNENIEFQEIDKNGKIVEMPDTEIYQYNDSPSIEIDDEHIGQKVLLPQNDQMFLSKIIKRKINSDGSLVGTKNSNPILDSRIYEVEYPDGSVAEYATNVITECLYSQMDDNGNYDFILSCITDHRCNSNSISKVEGWFTTKTGTRRRIITTKGGIFVLSGIMDPLLGFH